MQIALSVDDVSKIVESVFETMMNISVSRGDASGQPVGDRVTASVFLEGDWNGAVSLECNRTQAYLFAGAFLAMDPPDAMDDDVRDVLGELANIVGGNIKSVIAAETRLSMPSVVEGNDYVLRVCGCEAGDRIPFSFAGGLFWVTILAKGADSAQLTARKSLSKDSLVEF